MTGCFASPKNDVPERITVAARIATCESLQIAQASITIRVSVASTPRSL
jgi:hypothetical protein